MANIGPIGRLEGHVVGFETLLHQASRFPERRQLWRQLQQAQRTSQERALDLHQAWSQPTRPSTPQSVPAKGFNDSPVGSTIGSDGGKTVRFGGPAQEGPPPSWDPTT
jgi:hypothetical protein